MFTRLVSVALLLTSLSQPALAARQSKVIPYDSLQTRLTLRPGQTYLSFMQSQVKPALDAFQPVIVEDPAYRSHRYSELQSHLRESGAGVAIRINRDNYIFNLGYLNGSDPQNDVKSGRSYAVGPTGTQSDPSDLAYLRELEAYLKSEPDSIGDFVEALMRVIAHCDASGWEKLSVAGQGVASDFLAIYTAELDRHLMVNLAPRIHPWEIDLAAATFVSIFNAETGLFMKNGSLAPGSIELWWAQGTQGSGIGNTRRDRLALQGAIARHEAGTPEAREISEMIGKPSSADIIQGVLEYLNSPRAPKSFTKESAERLSQLMKQYLMHVRMNADSIAAEGTNR